MHSKNQISQKIALILFILYFCSLPLSLAGMELFFSLHLILTGFLFITKKLDLSGLKELPKRRLLYTSIIFGILYGLCILTSLARHDQLSWPSKLNHARDMKFFLVFAWAYFWTSTFKERLRKPLFILFPILIGLITAYGIIQAFIPMDLFAFFREAGKPVVMYRGTFSATIGPFFTYLTYGNVYMFYFVIFYMAALEYIQYNRKWLNWRLLLALEVGCSLVTTLSRNTWVNLFVMTHAMGFTHLKKRFILVFLMLTAFAVGFIFYHPVANQFITKAFDQSSDYQSFGVRLRSWQVHMKMLVEHPLFGAGHDQTIHLYENYRQTYFPDSDPKKHFPEHAHNTFLQLLAADGLIGFFIWMGFFILLGQFFIKYRHNSPWYGSKVGFWILLTFAVGGLTEHVLGDSEVSFNLMSLLGMAAGFCQGGKAERIEG